MVTEQDVKRYFDINGLVEINNDIVDVIGSVDMHAAISRIPFQFGKVTDDFGCSHSELTTLEGSPSKVGGKFSCRSNKLDSLKGSPSSVLLFSCRGNPDLTSLKDGPDEVKRTFFCDWIKDLPLLCILKYNRIRILNNDTVDDIMQKYVGKKPLRPAIIQCQRELIDAGYKGNARL